MRIAVGARAEAVYEIWQLPSLSSPELRRPRRIAGLDGPNLAIVEHRVAKRLRARGVAVPALGQAARHPLGEVDALNLGLLFRVLAPMRDRDKMRVCAEGVEAMAQPEAAYWLGMALRRRNPRRVLTALRYLLTEPKPRRKSATTPA
ncbi:MAG: hypothetical protein FJ100_17825 [Deltaproteobacteria bacterium]|nr:hypothetical protein [Deltaproteobacteria bacterium]